MPKRDLRKYLTRDLLKNVTISAVLHADEDNKSKYILDPVSIDAKLKTALQSDGIDILGVSQEQKTDTNGEITETDKLKLIKSETLEQLVIKLYNNTTVRRVIMNHNLTKADYTTIDGQQKLDFEKNYQNLELQQIINKKNHDEGDDENADTLKNNTKIDDVKEITKHELPSHLNLKFEDINNRLHSKENNHLILLGNPGCGKSTLIKKLLISTPSDQMTSKISLLVNLPEWEDRCKGKSKGSLI